MVEEAGLETDNMAESTATLQAKLKALTHGRVDIMLDADTFKSTTQILREMAAAWEHMTDIERASALELMGGKRQANILSSLISNYDIVEEVIQTSINSENSALEENAKYLDSMQGRIDKLTNSMQAMWVHAMDSELLKFLISVADGFVQATDKVGLLNVVLSAFMAKTAFTGKNFGIANLFTSVIEGANGATKGITLLGKALPVASTGFKIFNAAATMGVSLLAGALISGLVKLVDAIIVTTEEIKEAASQAENAIKSLSDEFKSDAKTVQDYAERFAELAQGVDMLSGKNLSLTTDDYAEFLDLSNQLADIFPTLSRNYDENGNAIVQLSGDTDTIVGSLYNLLDVQRQIANQQIAENLPDLYKGVKLNSNQYNTELENLIANRDTLQGQLKKIQDTDISLNIDDWINGGIIDFSKEGKSAEEFNNMVDDYIKILTDAGFKLEYLSTDYEYDKEAMAELPTNFYYKIANLDFLSEEEIEAAKGKITSGVNELAGQYATDINNLNNEIETTVNKNKANWGSIISSITSWLSTDSSYQVLNDEMQSVVQQMVNNIDFSSLDNVDTWEKMQEYIQTNIISKIQSATPEVQKAFAQLFKINTKDKTTNEYISAIQNKAQEIASSSDFTYEEILKNTGYEDIIRQYETSAENILRVLDDNIPKYYEKYEAGTRAHLNSLEAYGVQVEELKEKIYSLSPDKITKAFDIIKKYGINTWDELQEALEGKTFDVVLNYDKEKEGMEKLLAAIDESISATGLSEESIISLQNRYQNLENYDPSRLFEKTANGVHLNVQALRELEDEYQKSYKDDLKEQLKGQIKQYQNLTKKINECSNVQERATLYAQRQSVLDQIKDTAALASQYDGLTSAYYKWQKAQSNGNERDIYEDIISGRESMDELMSRGWIDDEVRAYIDLLSGKDLSTASYEEVLAAYKELSKEIGNSGHSIYDFFTKDKDGNSTTDGIFNFFDAVRSEMGETYAWIDKNGNYNFDFGIGGDQDVADKFGMDIEAVQAILRAASDAGFVVNLDSVYSLADGLQESTYSAEEATKKLKELELISEDIEFNFETESVDDLNKQIDAAQSAVNKLMGENTVLDLEIDGAVDAQTTLAILLQKKNELSEPSWINLDYSKVDDASDAADRVMLAFRDFYNAYNNHEINVKCGVDTETIEASEQEVQKYIDEIKSLVANNPDLKAQIESTLNITLDTVTPEAFAAALANAPEEEIVKLLPDGSQVEGYQVDSKTGEVFYSVGTDSTNPNDVNNWTPPTKYGTVVYTASTVAGQIFDKIFGGGSADGTAHVSGTAYSGGSWGAQKTETSLVGELGPEILVRNGRWTTVGENGAEFAQVKKGDIIFNHKQTESLLKNGYVTGRGKAHAAGTAFSDGTGPSRFTVTSAHIDGDGAKKLEDAADSMSEAADEFREVFDWIEVRLEEINEDISLRSAQLENKVGYKAQNKTVDKMIDLNQKLYDNLIAGSNRYHEYAEKLLAKVPEEYRKAAQDGTIAIEEFVGETDEKTLEAIQEYREWVQKGDNLTIQAEETLTEISNLAKQAIDNIAADYDNKTSLRQNKIDQYEAYNSLLETDQGFESTAIYQKMMAENNKIIDALEQQRNKMQEELNKRVETGEIKKYSQDWYDAVNDIAAVDTEIIELKTDTENWQDAINDLHWEKFDALMSRLESVYNEAENLIDILGNKDLVDESGNWTDEGVTSLGLYAQQMEAAEVQAKKYQEEIDYLNKNWQKLGYTEQEYVEKLDELKDGQHDAIKAYHDSKDAIVDLNKERVDAIKKGIEKEIEAYEELIKVKKEELDAEKDLYDFQKSIADKQKNIADIERKLAALSADNSASARAKRAQLEADLAEARAELEEAYYDRSISDRQDALDKELENFQETKNEEMEGWDEYLENTEQVVSDSLTTIQQNTEVVYHTLQTLGEEYGLSITESLISPWMEGENAIQSFSEKFGISMSATVDELKELELEFKETMLEIEQAGINAANRVKENAQGYTEAELREQDEHTHGGGNNNHGNNVNNGNSGNEPTGQYEDYIVKEGDTLSLIAKNKLGSSSKWRAIYDINKDKINNPDLIYAGQKLKLPKYAKGTKSVAKDQLSIIDELGDELQLIPDGHGRLAYMAKGTGVVPADLTANLMEWGAIDPTDMLERSKPQIGVSPSVVNNTTEMHIDASVGELLHIEHLDGNSPSEITKIVDKAWDRHMKELNAHVRRYTNR